MPRAAQSARVTLRSKRAKVDRRGHVRFKVRCSAHRGERCEGKLKLIERGKHASHRALAKGHFSLRRGKGALRERLTRRARRDLERHGRLRAALTLTVTELAIAPASAAG